MKELHQRTQPTFFWQGCFILLPVCVLAVVGLLSLRQDRLLAEQDAKQRAQQIADDLARKLADALATVSVSPRTTNWFDNFAADQVDTNCVFQIDEFARLVYPPDYPSAPVPRAFDEARLSAEQRRLWHSAQTAEFRKHDVDGAIEAYREFIATKPPPEFAVANFDLGLLLLKRGRTAEGAGFLAAIITNTPDAQLESGLPVAPLAELKLLELAQSHTNWVFAKDRAEAIASDAVVHPTLLTPRLLAETGKLQDQVDVKNTATKWERIWQIHEQTRTVYRATRQKWLAEIDAARRNMLNSYQQHHTNQVFRLDPSPFTPGTDSENPNAVPVDMSTGMLRAVITALLLEHSADQNAKDHLGRTPLCQAVEGRFLDTARLLLERKADPNVRYQHSADLRSLQGETPLYAAASNDDKRMADLLLSHGASVDAADNSGKTPFSVAVEMRLLEMAKLLLDHQANPNVKYATSSGPHDLNGKTPLYAATEAGDRMMVQLLLEHGADVNAKASNGVTPFFEAIQDRSPLVDVLIRQADVDVSDDQGRTPLHWAALKDDKPLAELLLARTANVNAKDKTGQTPLFDAVNYGITEIAELLLRHGADANAQTSDGIRPLFVAIARLDQTLVKLLLDHGAGLNLSATVKLPESGKVGRPISLSPLSYASALHGVGGLTPEQVETLEEIIDLLQKHGAK